MGYTRQRYNGADVRSGNVPPGVYDPGYDVLGITIVQGPGRVLSGTVSAEREYVVDHLSTDHPDVDTFTQVPLTLGAIVSDTAYLVKPAGKDADTFAAYNDENERQYLIDQNPVLQLLQRLTKLIEDEVPTLHAQDIYNGPDGVYKQVREGRGCYLLKQGDTCVFGMTFKGYDGVCGCHDATEYGPDDYYKDEWVCTGQTFTMEGSTATLGS